MSNEVLNPYQTFRDATGDVVENGTLTFNVNLTSTLDTIYSDEALTVAQANPYTLDASGRMTGDVRYTGKKRMILKDQAGATIRTLDNVATLSDNQEDLSFFAKNYATQALLAAAITSADVGSEFTTSEHTANFGYEGGNRYKVALVAGGEVFDGGSKILGTSGTSVYLQEIGSNPKITAAKFGVAFNDASAQAATNTVQLDAAINYAGEGSGGAQGNSVLLSEGVSFLDAVINIDNRVHLEGVNKRGSELKATSSHSDAYMITADNGTGSMFDNALRDMALNCNAVAGLGGVLSDAWQEGGGLNNALIYNFMTYGVRFQNTEGGAALCEIKQSEIFGDNLGATTGIYIDSTCGLGFLLKVSESTIAGGAVAMPKGIDFDVGNSVLSNVHFESCTSCVYIDGAGTHVLTGLTGSPTDTTTLIEIAATFTGSLTAIGCFRNGATNYLVDNRTGGYGTVTGVDFPVLTIGSADIDIASRSTLWASCLFDGSLADPIAPLGGFNVSSITKSAVGTYRVNLSKNIPTGSIGIGTANCNLSGGGAAVHVRVSAVSASSFDLFVYQAGTLIDSNEIHVKIAVG